MADMKIAKSNILAKPSANPPAPLRSEGGPPRSPSKTPGGLPNKGAVKRG
jgi:hypothetical protein